MIILQVILNGIGVVTTVVNILQFYKCSKRKFDEIRRIKNNIYYIDHQGKLKNLKGQVAQKVASQSVNQFLNKV